MAKRKIKIRFFTIADYIEEEKWLEKEHKNGLKLVKMFTPCFFIFEECDSEDAIYKLDYKNKKVTEDYIQMYEDYGWEYLDSCLGWNYFRKLDINAANENEKEIFSDSASKLNMINHVFKTRLLPVFIIFFAVIVPNLLRILSHNYGSTDIVLCIIYSVLFCLYLYIFVHCGYKLMKLRKELE